MKISRLASVSVAVGLAAGLAVGGSAPASGQATDGVIYGLDWESGILSTVDPATGVMTQVYQSSPPVGGAAAMYVDPVSLEIVVPTWDNNPWPVFAIDPGAGTQSTIAGTGKAVTAAAPTPTQNVVAYDIDGNSMGPSQMATIDSTTGAITDVAPFTRESTPVRVSALAYCSGELYAFIYRQGEDVFSVNTTTGALTLSLDTPGTVNTVYAADCNDEGTLYAVDQENLLKSANAMTALTLVAPLSGTPFTGILETLAVAANGSDAPLSDNGSEATLPDTGSSLEAAGITALIVAVLTVAGILLVTRRRARA